MRDGNYRSLQLKDHLIDFASNDTFGLSKRIDINAKSWGSTGSRLLTGNSFEAEELERLLASHYGCEAALLFNSGYLANLGLLSTVANRKDTIIFDSYIHASTRDGIRLSGAKSLHFLHNNINDLQRLLTLKRSGNLFVCVESLYSCDGSMCPIEEVSSLCKMYGAHLIVDEAHAIGIYGELGRGFVSNSAFAKVITFSKAFGLFGAAILCSSDLKDYLINFCRPLIYTTALPHPIIEAIRSAMKLHGMEAERERLHSLIRLFREGSHRIGEGLYPSQTHIQAFKVPGNENAKNLSKILEAEGFDIRALLSPTVPLGEERLRICLHSYNTEKQISLLINILENIYDQTSKCCDFRLWNKCG